MRTALLSTALATGIALGGAPLVAAPAWAGSTASSGSITAVAAATPTPAPAVTPATQSNDNDHTGRYGLIGLSGLFGLFGYKKYRDLQTSRPSSRGGPIGGVDTDGSGSRRV
jgi:hypothetical protein